MSTNNYTYSEPKDKAEYISLLNEAIRIGKELNKQLDQITIILEEEYSSSAIAA